MPKYQKKPIIIEAEQYTGETAKGMCVKSSCFLVGIPHVHTAHRNQAVKVEIGDYIITEPNGENFYPCKAEIFEANHVLVS